MIPYRYRHGYFCQAPLESADKHSNQQVQDHGLTRDDSTARHSLRRAIQRLRQPRRHLVARTLGTREIPPFAKLTITHIDFLSVGPPASPSVSRNTACPLPNFATKTAHSSALSNTVAGASGSCSARSRNATMRAATLVSITIAFSKLSHFSSRRASIRQPLFSVK